MVMSAVMSVHRMSAAGGFRYLLRHTATGDTERGQQTLVDYYATSGNPPGRWVGAGLGGLGDGVGVAPGSVVTEAAMSGADCATIPPEVFLALFKHPLTERGLQQFMADWAQTGQTIL